MAAADKAREAKAAAKEAKAAASAKWKVSHARVLNSSLASV